MHIKESDSVSTLGVVWSSHLDSFTLKFDLNQGKNSILNKRILLSEISKLFDPLGWFSPVFVLAKILIQDLRLLYLDWDFVLPQYISEKWDQFKLSLPSLTLTGREKWSFY